MKRPLLLLLSALTALSCLSTAAFAVEETLLLDHDQIAADYLAATAGQHPNILYTADDLPALREKTADGVSAMALSAMKTLAAKYMQVGVSPYKYTGSGISGRTLQLQIATLTFCGQMLEGDVGQKYIDHAVKMLVSAAETGSLAIYQSENDALCVGDFGCAYAIGYDWLYDEMTEEQRKLIYDEMTEIGEWLYTASTTGRLPGTNTVAYWAEDSAHRSAWNWNTVTHTALGMISMATGEHPEWLSRSLVRIEAYLQNSKNADGLPYEGIGYTGYGMRMVVLMDSSLADHTGVSFIDSYPDVQNFPEYLLWATLPKGREVLNINQSNSLGNIAVAYYIANRCGQSENLWGILHAYGLASGKTDLLTSVWGGDSFDLPQLIVFEDKELKPTAPEAGGMKVFGTEEVIIRTGFGSSSAVTSSTTLASMHIRAGHPSIWHHLDCGSVTFHALGQSYIIDLGAGSKDASLHNGLMIDGKGTVDATRASLTAAEILADDVYLVSADLAAAYTSLRPRTCTRTLLVADGAAPYIFVFDNATGGKGMTGSSNWYIADNAMVKETDAGLRLKGSGKGACYVYAFAPTGEISVKYVEKTHAVRVSQEDVSEVASGTLFAVTPDADKAPEVTCTYDEDGTMLITVLREDADGAMHTDTITASAAGVTFATEITESEETTAETPAETSAETSAAPAETAAGTEAPAAAGAEAGLAPAVIGVIAAAGIAAGAVFAIVKRRKM